jgi:hypothetical protein
METSESVLERAPVSGSKEPNTSVDSSRVAEETAKTKAIIDDLYNNAYRIIERHKQRVKLDR